MPIAGPEAMAGVLGIAGTGPKATTLDIVDQIQKGFPVKALYRVSGFLAPGDVNFKFQIVSRATLARRKKQPGTRLSAYESDRLARLASSGLSRERSGATTKAPGRSCSGPTRCSRDAGLLT